MEDLFYAMKLATSKWLADVGRVAARKREIVSNQYLLAGKNRFFSVSYKQEFEVPSAYFLAPCAFLLNIFQILYRNSGSEGVKNIEFILVCRSTTVDRQNQGQKLLKLLGKLLARFQYVQTNAEFAT